MIHYPDGTEAQIRDRVCIDHGSSFAVVHAVIDSEDQQRAWGLDEPGLMLDAQSSGMVFWPIHSLVTDEIEFVARNSAQ